MVHDPTNRLKPDQDVPDVWIIPEEMEGGSSTRGPSEELSDLRRQAAASGEVDLEFEPVPEDSTAHIQPWIDLINKIPSEVRTTVRFTIDSVRTIVTITEFIEVVSKGPDFKKIVPLVIYYVLRYTRFMDTPED